jgi:uncharacterized membrane protein (TIGR02234 family)
VTEPDSRKRGRQLGLVAVVALAGAAFAAFAANVTWWSANYLDPLAGALAIAASGADCVPELIPLALVGLAGFGAALATRGALRRVIGVVILLCGSGIAVRSAVYLGVQPDVLVTGLTRPADPVGVAELHALGPLLGILGGVLLTVAGVLIVLGLGARQQLGARYERQSGPKAADPADWWKALDAGGDPTAEPVASGTGDPETLSTPTGAAESPPTVSEHTSGDGYHDPNASRPS